MSHCVALEFSQASIQAQLEKVLSSKEFLASERNKRFLRYVVEETLSGHAERLKAYTIAVAVFERNGSFDPQADPIVRIEASRLRRCLERYYLTAGQDDPIRISIPKGGYVPSFEEVGGTPTDDDALPAPADPASLPAEAARPRLPIPIRRMVAFALAALVALGLLAWFGLRPAGTESTAAPARGPAVLARGPTLIILPFANLSGDLDRAYLADGMTQEIITKLTRFNDLFVLGAATSFRYAGAPDLRQITEQTGIDYVLTGSLRLTPRQIRVAATLSDPRSGRYLWSGTFDHELTSNDILAIQDEIANEVVRTLADPYGVIFQQKVKEYSGRPPDNLSSYECVLRSYQYWRQPTPEQHATIRDCLERTVQRDPGYAAAWANLALLYCDEYRYRYNMRDDPEGPLTRALAAAHQALQLAPDDVRAYQALHLAYWLRRDVPRSFAAAEHALALNPNNSEVMADLGGRLILTGNLEKGMPLLREAFARNPAQPDLYRIGFVVFHYARGDYAQALAEARKIDLPNNPYVQVTLAMTYGQLGQQREAHEAIDSIRALHPALADDPIQELEQRNLSPDLLDHIADGLRKAGLFVKPRPREASSAP